MYEKLTDAGDIIHSATCTTRNEQSFKWGNVTYSDVRVADEAKSYINNLDLSEMPYNVERINLRFSRFESVTPQNNSQSSGVRVLVSWFPLPTHGIAYIKCRSPAIAMQIVHQISETLTKSKSSLKRSGDVAVHVDREDDEFTVKELLEGCCTPLQIEAVSKITVPSVNEDVNLDVEREKLFGIMKEFECLQVLKLWLANCKKVRACVVFEDLETAKRVVRVLNKKIGVLGARAMYMEFDNKREIMCDGRVYEKIRKTVEEMKRKKEDVEIQVEKCHKRMKMTVTGDSSDKAEVSLRRCHLKNAHATFPLSCFSDRPSCWS